MAVRPWCVLATVASLCLSTLPAIADPSCYMVTSSGKKIPLTGMCSGKTTPTRSATPSYSYPTQRQINQRQNNPETGDYLVKEGTGGQVSSGVARDFHYQVWSNRMNTRYTLKVWDIDNYPQGYPESFTGFRSVGEAETHFDCRYTNKRLPACPWNQ